MIEFGDVVVVVVVANDERESSAVDTSCSAFFVFLF